MRELCEVVGGEAVRACRLAGNREAHHLDFLANAPGARHRRARCPRGQPRRIGDLVPRVGLPRQHGEIVGGEVVVGVHTSSLVGAPVRRLASR